MIVLSQSVDTEIIASTPEEQQPSMAWMLSHMPPGDREHLTDAYLIENLDLAWNAWQDAAWHAEVPHDVFLDAILPYASINERRDDWRAMFHEQFAPLVADAKSPGEAAAILNNEIFKQVGVIYSTDRPKADQSPLETIEAGMASCTGLSIMLVDACRSVGVPARFVGTPLWSDKSGNHSWVEVWDEGQWKFTGAAEPRGMELNRAWFADRAGGAVEGDPQHAILAVTWRDVPRHFPLPWLADDTSVGAVDVTRTYTSSTETLPEGHARLRVRVIGENGRRIAAPVQVEHAGNSQQGVTRDDRFDANDHWTAVVPIDSTVTVKAGDRQTRLLVHSDQQLLTLTAGELTREQAAAAVAAVVAEWSEAGKAAAIALLERGELVMGEHAMPFSHSRHGETAAGSRPLVISMHGGGGAPAEVNDDQWRNQQSLYDIDQGIYLAPRAPTNTWNLWHQSHIDPMFDALITAMVLAEGVDPNRVYLTGFSAGGDGVFQLAPRMADRFAAAAMMAGHPNETKPDGLRNLPFTIHVGAEDGAYDRNLKASEWKAWLARMRADDPQGYPHWVEIHDGKSHWMDHEDAEGVRWMFDHTRDLRPRRIVWLQDDVLRSRFYWLAVDEPTARDRMVVERNRQDITIVEAGVPKNLRIRLDDRMVNLDEPIRVLDEDGRVLFEGLVARRASVIEATMAERGDPDGVFSAEVGVDLR